MKFNQYIIFLSLILVLILPNVSLAEDSQSFITFFDGLYIEHNVQSFYTLENISVNYQVYNNKGINITNSICDFYLFSQEGIIFSEKNVLFDSNNLYSVVIDKDELRLGQSYTSLFQCELNDEGGFVSQKFKITEDGTDARELQTGGSALIIILSLIFIGLIMITFVFDNPAFKVGSSIFAVGIVPLIINITTNLINISYPYTITRLLVEESLGKLSAVTTWIFFLYLVFAIVYLVIYYMQKFAGAKVISTPYDNEMGDLKKW